MIKRLSVMLITMLVSVAGSAATDDAFDVCVDNLKTEALAQGIDKAVVESVLSKVEPLERVISSDRSQPEFTQTFSEYYSRRVSQLRIDKGRQKLAENAEVLAKIKSQSGVPAHYLMAFWGLETNFGGFFGKLSMPSALATLACDSRRSAYFTAELLAILQIVASGDIKEEQLVGSWAGAIGHMQFMPTTFLAHAQDGDGDGRRDLIGNEVDALSSGAAYLKSLGWQSGYRWGREVVLPEDFDYLQSGTGNWRSLETWTDLGVTDVFGNRMVAADLQAALLLPTGHTGPAFLVYPNFNVIMGWNRSEYYALSVGRLADRIAGAGRLHKRLPAATQIQFSTATVSALQHRLNDLGLEAGKPDGIIGPATRKAIQKYQSDNKLLADGYPDQALLGKLEIDAKPQ